eukprot:4934104-Amphidinium_carterae.1
MFNASMRRAPVHDVLCMNVHNGLQDLLAKVNDLQAASACTYRPGQTHHTFNSKNVQFQSYGKVEEFPKEMDSESTSIRY